MSTASSYSACQKKIYAQNTAKNWPYLIKTKSRETSIIVDITCLALVTSAKSEKLQHWWRPHVFTTKRWKYTSMLPLLFAFPCIRRRHKGLEGCLFLCSRDSKSVAMVRGCSRECPGCCFTKPRESSTSPCRLE